MTGVCSFSDNSVISRNVSYSNTYTVNPDCTGAPLSVDENGLVRHFDLFFGSDGEEVSFVQTDPGVVAAEVERQVRK
jgi:hypothetical protein